ncbi:MAG: hypothetical protein IH865_02865 [Chloroflexi bacterium]|nr:hypothetical protein [Chloroflexota bacterium]
MAKERAAETVTRKFVDLNEQRYTMRWVLLVFFLFAYAIGFITSLVFISLVGLGLLELPTTVLVGLSTATVGNSFAGLVSILGFAFGKIQEA